MIIFFPFQTKSLAGQGLTRKLSFIANGQLIEIDLETDVRSS